MATEEHYEIYKDESDARGVAKELRENRALDILVRLGRDKKSGRWRVSVRSSLPSGYFGTFDNGYVLAFLTAWKIAAEGAA